MKLILCWLITFLYLFSDNGPCLGMRTGPNLEYEWMSYQEVYHT